MSRWRRGLLLAACLAITCTALIAAGAVHTDQPLTDSVGVIEGESISVTGPMSAEVLQGQVRTVLHSGGDVRVKSGSARIDLVEGGQVSICGPAHLWVLKSGGSLTIALDTGTVHVHLERDLPLTIYTPFIQAQIVAIGDGPRDALVGFDPSGAMCIRANLGAIRVEQQLTGQSVLIPQTGDVFLFNGQLDNLRTSVGHSACDLQVAKAAPPRQPVVTQSATVEAPSPTEQPIYPCIIPPPPYDATAK